MALKANTLLNTDNLLKVCNQTAASYPEASVVATEIGRRLLDSLEVVRLQPQRILDLGCADGRMSHTLATLYPEAMIVGVDWAWQRLPKDESSRLPSTFTGLTQNDAPQGKSRRESGVYTEVTEHFEETFNTAGRVLRKSCFVAADMHQLPFAANSFDLIIANLTLEWSPHWAQIIRDLYQVTAPGGLLHFATSGPDTLRELRLAWQLADPFFPHVHPFVDMHHLGDALLQTGYQDPVMYNDVLTCLYRSPEQLLRELKDNGLQNQLQEQRQTLTGKNRFAKMAQFLQDGSDESGRIPITVEVAYGHAWKPQPPAQQPSGDEAANGSSKVVRIDVADIRKNLPNKK